jgi:hypothetical protein
LVVCLVGCAVVLSEGLMLLGGWIDDMMVCRGIDALHEWMSWFVQDLRQSRIYIFILFMLLPCFPCWH